MRCLHGPALAALLPPGTLPAQAVVQGRVTPHDQPPPELTMMETWDSMVPWIWAGTLIALGALVALIVWLVRRSRRRDPLMGQTGTP